MYIMVLYIDVLVNLETISGHLNLLLDYSSHKSSGRGGGRSGTGEDWMIVVVVEPYKRKQSRSRSSWSMAGMYTLRIKQSSPVTRLHSTTLGICWASSAILESGPRLWRMRMY